jgi:hypothetical protein
MTLPTALKLFLEERRLRLDEVCVLEFDAYWQPLEKSGAVAHFALHNMPDSEISALFQALCLGLPRTRGAELKHVGLPHGQVVDLRLYSLKRSVFVLLVDVREEVEKARNWQQNAQETELLSYEKTRELRRSRTRGQSLKSQLIALRRTLWLERAQNELLLLRMAALANSSAPDMLRCIASHRAADAGAQACSVEELAQNLRHTIADRVDITVQGEATRSALHSSWANTEIFLPILVFAHARNLTGQTRLTLSADPQQLRAELISSGPDLGVVETQLLWEQALPERDLDKSETALLLFAERLSKQGGRVTRSFSAGVGAGELKLSISVPKTSIAPLATTRVRLGVGAQFWVLSQREEQLVVVRRFIQARGFEMQQHFDVSAMLQRIKDSPPHVILADASEMSALKFVFRARGEGYSGRAIALGNFSAGSALSSVFDGHCEQLSDATLAQALALQDAPAKPSS